jgi:hypothetical protein
VKRLICWWFGCDPDYERSDWRNSVVPCRRCGAFDTDYGDRVGHTRSKRAKDWFLSHFVRWWLPHKCTDCFKRYGNHDDCIPF